MNIVFKSAGQALYLLLMVGVAMVAFLGVVFLCVSLSNLIGIVWTFIILAFLVFFGIMLAINIQDQRRGKNK